MKAVVEIEFRSAGEAKKAADILKESKTDEATRASVKVENKNEKLVVTVAASDYTALRALTTTLLRDLKVVTDGFKAVKN